ncbi:MAG: hypothetical protein KKH92_04225 [Firmicutes bacterium]|nr:hypothetical protein [Bacillota bacterium]
MEIKQLIEKEIKGCFDYFWYETNSNQDSKGYGLALDSSRNSNMASIAAVGFALSAYVIGVNHQYITFEQGYERTLKTLQTVTNHVDHKNGFYIHFLNIETAENYGLSKGRPSEYSTIDTAILLMGALSASEFFKGEVKEIVDQMLESTDWDWLIHPDKPVFRMSYHMISERFPTGWSNSKWDHYAEQLMMYFLYAGQKKTSAENARKLYFGFDRHVGAYKGQNYVYCFGNALFIHQFSHAFIDFKTYVDAKMFNWFENSVAATKANKAWCLDQSWSKTLSQGYWGLTAMHNKKGYLVVGGPPWGFTNVDYRPNVDGTVAPYAALSSIIFTKEDSLDIFKKFAEDKNMWGKYGLYDAFNFEDEPWYSNTYIGIDKGPTIIMLDNYLNQTIQNLVTNSEFIQEAFKKLGFTRFDDFKYTRMEGK